MMQVVTILLVKVGTSIMIKNGRMSARAAEMIMSQRRSAARHGDAASGAYGRREMCFSNASADGSVLVVLVGEVAPLRAMRPPSSRSWASSVSVVEMRKGFAVALGRDADVEVM